MTEYEPGTIGLTEDTKIWKTYRFPNNNVVTYDSSGNQIIPLQGVYTKELRDLLEKHSDSKTVWSGF